MSKKSIFQQFIEANEALLDCYETVDPTPYKGQPVSKSAGVCISQKEKLKSIVASNEMTMTRVVQERIDILNKIYAKSKANPKNRLIGEPVRYNF